MAEIPQKKFTFAFLLSNLQSLFLSVVTLVLTRYLTPEDRGRFTVLILVYLASSIVTDRGSLGTITFFSAQDRQYSQLMSWARARILLSFSSFGILVIALSLSLSLIRTLDAIVLLFYVGCSYLISGNLHWLQSKDILLWRKIQFLQIPLCLLICYWLVTNSVTALGAFAAMYFSTLLPSAIALLFIKQRIQSTIFVASTPKEILNTYARRTFLWDLSLQFFARVDSIVIGYLLGVAALGQYSVATSWMLVSTPIVSALGHISFPLLASIAHDSTRQRAFRRRILFTMIPIMLLIALLLTFLGAWLIPNLLGNDYRDASSLLPLIFLSTVIRQLIGLISETARGSNFSLFFSFTIITGGIAILCAPIIFQFDDAKTVIILFTLIQGLVLLVNLWHQTKRE